MAGVVFGEVEDGGFANAAGSWEVLVEFMRYGIGLIGCRKGYGCWEQERVDVPPVRRMTLPERSGTSVSGLKPQYEDMMESNNNESESIWQQS